MRRIRGIGSGIVFTTTIATMTGALAAHAKVYPVNQCVSIKQKAAGTYCKAVLKAWAKWEVQQDSAQRDALLTQAAARLDGKWGKAETKALAKGSDCSETTLSAAALRALVDSAADAITAQVNGGLDLDAGRQATCGAVLLRAAASYCRDMLGAEGDFIRNLGRDPHAVKRDARKTKAGTGFARRWANMADCPTTATVADSEARIASLTDSVVRDTIVSPNVDDTQFTTITPVGAIPYEGNLLNPLCMNGSPYSYFVKRGTVNRLLVYYQGGGACWENVTCTIPACDTAVDPSGSDNPNSQHSGFADGANPLNPFRDWNMVFVSYCSCDIHFGDATRNYVGVFPPIHVEHRGYANARVVEKWAREHFVNPERVFVTGSSAGAYGAWFNAPLHQLVWPASHFDVLADAGNGVITQDFLDNEFPSWNFAANLPTQIPGVADSLISGIGITGYSEIVARYFPDTRWAHYSTAFDGGNGGQTGFYQLMLNPGNWGVWPNWWEASCAFNTRMRQQAADIAAAVPSNYRYYIGAGSRHTMWGSDRVYSSTAGGVPTVVDWVNGMLANDAAWVNVEANPSNVLLSGDPRPSPLQAPFASSGGDVVVSCP